MVNKAVQTKRTEKSKHNWTKRVGHAIRGLNKRFYYKWKCRGE